jgi:hypothetical protein
MKEIKLTDKQYECLKKLIKWHLYWSQFISKDMQPMLKRIQKRFDK